MDKNVEIAKTTSESIKAELIHLTKLYQTRKSALEKMSNSILEGVKEADNSLENETKIKEL